MHMKSAVCSSCDAEMPADARYCPECGQGRDAPGSSRDEETTSEARTLAALTHILGFLTWVLGPLVVLLIAEDPFVVKNAKNALMWQVMVMVYGIVSLILVVVVVGMFMLMILGIVDLVFCVIAAIKASQGETWAYPLTPSV